MKQKEFLQLIDQYGLNLNKLSITIGEASGWEGAHGVYFKNGTWFYYSADGRNHIDESALENEDEAFEKMMKYVFLDLDTKRYLTKIIDEDIVKIRKETVCRFIQEKYAMSEQQANDAWTYLRQDMHVLFEFKYYVAKGGFVPDKYCYKVQGYSAEQLHTTTYLEVLGAFNYLIYLATKPQEALANLKKGLPRRKNYSEKDLEKVQKTMDEKNVTPVEGAEQVTEASDRSSERSRSSSERTSRKTGCCSAGTCYFTELLEATKDLDLEALGVSLGKAANRIETISCFMDGDEWVMQEINDRQRVFEKRGKEEDIVRKVYGNIKLRIRQPK